MAPRNRVRGVPYEVSDIEQEIAERAGGADRIRVARN